MEVPLRMVQGKASLSKLVEQAVEGMDAEALATTCFESYDRITNQIGVSVEDDHPVGSSQAVDIGGCRWGRRRVRFDLTNVTIIPPFLYLIDWYSVVVVY
jgi:hypothetical protein